MSPGKDVAHRSRWPYISLIPIGFGAWAPIYAGVKAREPKWVALGALWTAMIVIALLVSGGHGHGNDGLVGALAIIAWVGGIATSFSIRSAYDHQMGSPVLRAAEVGEQRLRDRQRALRIAQGEPRAGQGDGDRPPRRQGHRARRAASTSTTRL